jgi:hypothetical protein
LKQRFRTIAQVMNLIASQIRQGVQRSGDAAELRACKAITPGPGRNRHAKDRSRAEGLKFPFLSNAAAVRRRAYRTHKLLNVISRKPNSDSWLEIGGE